MNAHACRASDVCRGMRDGHVAISRERGAMYISIGAAILIVILLVIFVF
jgi:hypothetical protein